VAGFEAYHRGGRTRIAIVAEPTDPQLCSFDEEDAVGRHVPPARLVTPESLADFVGHIQDAPAPTATLGRSDGARAVLSLEPADTPIVAAGLDLIVN